MKNIMLIILLLNINDCSLDKDFNYYEGYIYNKNNAPVSEVDIFEKERPDNKTRTNKNGFFKLSKQKGSISTFLIVKKNQQLIDSIQVVRTSGGEKMNYYFVEGRKDTLFINLK